MRSLPKNRSLNELDLYKIINRLKVKYFRGVFMRDALPMKPNFNECAVINLDSIQNAGTHWTAYCKKGKSVYYFDSFGNLQPPKELIDYFGSDVKIYYNNLKYQEFGTVVCGQLCITFLHYFNKRYF